ncbi:transposase [Trichonephila clavata]|uniref:Transposase n=1 Tax=Trichonephila clavata TaxID=2740835 RepID=A0A8X6JRX9_TRICU|nr:transposase [Trichonephila clavata]
MWGDMGYQGKDLKDHIKREYDIEIEIVKRPPSRFWVHKDTPPELLPKVEPGFKVQPRRFKLDDGYEVETTLLHIAIQCRKSAACASLVQCLLDQGADPNV